MNRPARRRPLRAQSRPPRRSLLFVPGDSIYRIEKAVGLDVDSIVMDLEDRVALGRKEAARETVAEAVRRLDFGRHEVLVRINPVDTEFAIDDLRATVDLSPHGYVVPKVEEPEHLVAVSRFVADVEKAQGRRRQGIRLLALIETAKGVMNLREIAGATTRLDALIFGAENLIGDMGAIRTLAGAEVFYARSAVVTAAAAFGLQAIDTVFVELDDLAGLQDECTLARQMGYSGRLALHPRHLPVINLTFSPADEEVPPGNNTTENETAVLPAARTAAEIFAELRRAQPTITIHGRIQYIVEGDLCLDEVELLDYAAEREVQQASTTAEDDLEPQGLASVTDDDRRIVRWKKGLVLTYAVLKSTFADDEHYQVVVDAMEKATADWEATAGVNFQHLEQLDGGLEPDGEQPVFVVEGLDTNGKLIAGAFFPDDPPSERRIILDPSYFSSDLGYDQVGVLRHELGHVLGFRHEHIRSGAPAICPDEPGSETIDLTEYDPQSVMHYFCGGVGSTDMEITELDRQGARAVYGPPDSEVAYYE